jgi:hypothetical protein
MGQRDWERLLRPFGLEAICAVRGPGTSCRVCNCFTQARWFPTEHSVECPVRFLAWEAFGWLQSEPGTPAVHPRAPS